MLAPLQFHPIFIESLVKQPSFKCDTYSGINNASNEAEFRVEMDMPGMKQADLNVTVEEEMGLVSVEGIRKYTNSKGETTKKARVSKTFSVDTATVDISKLQANLSEGVLVVTAPKKPKSAPRKITVTAIPQESEEGKKSIEQHSSADEDKNVKE